MERLSSDSTEFKCILSIGSTDDGRVNGKSRGDGASGCESVSKSDIWWIGGSLLLLCVSFLSSLSNESSSFIRLHVV